MAPPLLMLRDIRLTFGGTPLLEGAELSVSRGERLCLVGRNGSGKSTLLKIAAGLVEPDGGERFRQPGTTVRYLSQEPDLAGHETALSFVEAGLAPGDDRHRARYLLEHLGLSGDERPDTLSGGESRRCALARALAPRPDILLLDEPTNHLDLPAIEWLEDELRESRSALVLVSHDRRFLEALSNATIWLANGATVRLEKGFAAFEPWRDALVEADETERRKLDRRIAAETEWLRKGVTARRKRNQGRLRALKALREERRNRRQAPGAAQLTAADGLKSGKLVIEADGISKSYGGRPIVSDLSLRIRRGDRLGIVGPNGAGKTTLVELLTGALSPDGGTVCHGTRLEAATIDQRRESLDPDTSLADTLALGGADRVAVADGSRHVISYMKDFLFVPEQAGTPVSALSGGERGRLLLARALSRPANLMVLDEPTIDLDLETLDLLQEMLADFAGTVILVSHDRDFLDRVVTSVIAAEGDGRWVEYAGGYTDMIAQRGGASNQTTPEAVAKPQRNRGKTNDRETPRTTAKGRLSYKKKRALETLPARMEELRRDVARHRETLADPDLFARDPRSFETAAAALREAEENLARAEDEWLEIEIEREALES